VHASASFPLLELVLPASAAVSDEDAKLHPRPEIAHVLRAPRDLPPVAVSGGFAGLVLAPYLALAFLVRALPFTYPFAATLMRLAGQRNKAGMTSRHQLCSRSRVRSRSPRAFSYVSGSRSASATSSSIVPFLGSSRSSRDSRRWCPSPSARLIRPGPVLLRFNSPVFSVPRW
jgi:hypothetical protein